MRKRFKEKYGLHPIVTYLILIFIVVGLSFVFSLFHLKSTYKVYSTISKDFKIVSESVTSLFNLSGIKYIFTSTVSNFANFSVLSNFIIILIGLGILEYSGFLKTFVLLTTKKSSKFTVTFIITFLAVLSSLLSDIMFLVFIPISALVFYHAKRTPILGIINAYAALTIGNGISLLMSSMDLSIREITLQNAFILDPTYKINYYGYLFISLLLVVVVSYVITKITETYTINRVEPYEYEEEEIEITNTDLRGIIFSVIAGATYLIIIAYNLIPNLPLSGNLLDYREAHYINKLFSYDSFFNQGFVFIIAVFFVILGLAYGKGAKTIKNNKETADSLSSSLDDIGKPLILIFLASILINILKKTNIGISIITVLSNLITNLGFTGIPLILLLFVISFISGILVPQTLLKWPIIASHAVPSFMKSGLTPEFAQIIYRLGETVALGLTPLFLYFVIYLAYIEKYNQNENQVNLFTTIKYQIPYVIVMSLIFIGIILLWYFAGFPLGIATKISI